MATRSKFKRRSKTVSSNSVRHKNAFPTFQGAPNDGRCYICHRRIKSSEKKAVAHSVCVDRYAYKRLMDDFRYAEQNRDLDALILAERSRKEAII